MSELAGASWAGGWDEPGVLSIVLIQAGTPGSGLFMYSGVPAAGNLIYSITAANGTDLFGNATLRGATNYTTVAGGVIALQVFAGQILWYHAATEAGPWTATAEIVVNNAGTIMSVIAAQLQVTGGPLVATAGTPASPSVISTDTWNAMSPLSNGWANAAGNVTAQYRLVASPPNSVEIIGAITAAAATAGTFFTLPAGYVPAHNQQIPAGATGGVTAATVSPFITVNSAGAVFTNEVGLGAANIVVFHGTISLDA